MNREDYYPGQDYHSELYAADIAALADEGAQNMPDDDNLTIVVDGIDYEVEYTEPSMGNPGWVVVWDKSACLVANAEIDHNSECICVQYDSQAEPNSYNYFEYANYEEIHGIEEASKELARWMISTSY